MQKYAIPRTLRKRKSTISCQSIYDPNKVDDQKDIIQCTINLVPNKDDNWDKFTRGMKSSTMESVSSFQFEIDVEDDSFTIDVIGLCDEENVTCKGSFDKRDITIIQSPEEFGLPSEKKTLVTLSPPPPPSAQPSLKPPPSVLPPPPPSVQSSSQADTIALQVVELLKKQGLAVAGGSAGAIAQPSYDPMELERMKKEEKERAIKRRQARAKMEGGKGALISELAFVGKFKMASTKKECENLQIIEEPLPNERPQDKEAREQRNESVRNIVPMWIDEPVRFGQGMCVGFDTVKGTTIPKLDNEKKCEAFNELNYDQLDNWNIAWDTISKTVERKIPIPKFTKQDLQARIDTIKKDPKINALDKPAMIQDVKLQGEELMNRPQEFEIKTIEIEEGQCLIEKN